MEQQKITRHDRHVGDHMVPIFTAGPPGGPTFVLVHGIGVSHRYFERFMIELAKTHRVIALDMPGFGDASRPKQPLSIHSLGQLVYDVIKHEGIQQPIVVGHSMGCQVVASLLMNHPSVAKKAILVGPTVDPQDRTRISHFVRLLRDSMSESFRVNKIVFADYIRCGPTQYLGTLNHMLADRIEDHLPKCRADILIMRGARDPIVSLAWAEKAAELARGSYIEVAGAQHVVQHARPAELAMRFVEFAHA